MRIGSIHLEQCEAAGCMVTEKYQRIRNKDIQLLGIWELGIIWLNGMYLNSQYLGRIAYSIDSHYGW
jgi:hypothetical protein